MAKKIHDKSKSNQRADGLENAFSRKGTRKSKTGMNSYEGLDYLPAKVIRDIYGDPASHRPQ